MGGHILKRTVIAALAPIAAGCAQPDVWPGEPVELDRRSVAQLVADGAPPRSAADYGICGAALVFDANLRAGPLAFDAGHRAELQGQLLVMTLASPDPPLSFSYGQTVLELPMAERIRLADRVEDCRRRYGRFFRA